MQPPISPYTETLGMLYFARMLDKIRKYAKGGLREDFHQNLGQALDARCCHFLRVDYTEVKAQVLSGMSDEAVLNWCYQNGRQLDETDCFIWNEYTRKIGWNDSRTEFLEKYKAESGLENRRDLKTMFDYMEVDEGRKD